MSVSPTLVESNSTVAGEGVLDYGVLGCPGYVMWAGQMRCEDTR